MTKTLIIVEGKDDKHFVDYLLKDILNKSESNYDIFENGGYGVQNNNVSIIRQKLKTECDHIIIINDQDDVYKNRLRDMLAGLQKLDIIMPAWKLRKQIFLVPKNIDENKNTTTTPLKFQLESLLFECAKDKNPLQCYDQLIQCFQQSPHKENYINVPDHHTKAYVYIDIHLNAAELNERNKSMIHKYAYHRNDIWDFDCEAIQPLLYFLDRNVI